MRDPLSVWVSPSYVPTEHHVLQLAMDAVALSGGRRESGTHESKAKVTGALSAWFSSEIPELLRAGDDQAIEQQAYFLLNSEGSTNFKSSWAYAVIDAFPAAMTGRPLFYAENGDRPVNTRGGALPLLVRGMQLYAGAFAKLAVGHGIGSLKVFRALPDSQVDGSPLLTGVAAVGWNRRHRQVDGSTVWSTEVDPYQVVGVTLSGECHPMVTPFRLDRGPGGGLLQWR